MNEEDMFELMQNLDCDLIEKEIEELSENIEIDMESISKRAREKLKKENATMIKKKRYPIIAAALIVTLSVSAVYASEITDFLKTFFDKKEIYSTVVDGDAFYLKSPVVLDENNSLENIIFTKDELIINIATDIKEDSVSDFGISIVGGSTTYVPGGYGVGKNDIYSISFYNGIDNNYTFFPTNRITLNIGDNSYELDLSEGEAVTAKGEIHSAGNNSGAAVIDWINVGFKQTDKGVQILTSFADEELKLSAIGNPSAKVVISTFDFEESISTSTFDATDVLIGYDKNNNAYEFDWDKNATGRPVTIFESDAPKDVELELIIPSLIVEYDYRKDFPTFNIDIPDLNQEIIVNKEVDLIIQKMVLKSIERTSDTTAELVFDLNTGDKKEAFIRNALLSADDNIKKIECVWDGNTCTMTITFDKDVKNADISISVPKFVVEGNWSLNLNSQE